MDINQLRLANRKLFLVVSSDEFESDEKFLDFVASSLQGGVQILLYRDKNSTARKIIRLGKRLRELCSIYNALFIVNDRVDIAQIIEADGIHLGQDDIDICFARQILEPEIIIGVSTHSEEQAVIAQNQGADYIVIDQSLTEWASENIRIPFFVVNDVGHENVEEIISSCGKRVVVSSSIQNNKSPENAVTEMLNKLNQN